MNKEYLGASVYAEMDGDMIKFTTDNGQPDAHRNIIYLEPLVVQKLIEYAQRMPDHWKRIAQENARE